MAVLKNQRHELFAQHLFAGKTADEAYELAGFKPNRGNATRLKANESIQARVKELQGAVVRKTVISKEWVIEKLIAVHNSAVEGNPVLDRYGHATERTIVNHAGANKALELLGKELGMFVERRENTNRNISEAPSEELRAELARLKSERDKRADTVH